jgi:hypothetical protein
MPGTLRAATEADDRLDTAMRETENIPAVEGGATQAGPRTGQLESQVGDATDVGVVPAPMASTEEERVPADPSVTEQVAAQSGPSEPDHTDRNRPSASDLMATIDRDLPQAAGATSTSEQTPVPTIAARAQSQVPVSTAPSSLPPPEIAEAAITGPRPACPQCEAPMAWVDVHLRFYCKSCRMYF